MCNIKILSVSSRILCSVQVEPFDFVNCFGYLTLCRVDDREIRKLRTVVLRGTVFLLLNNKRISMMEHSCFIESERMIFIIEEDFRCFCCDNISGVGGCIQRANYGTKNFSKFLRKNYLYVRNDERMNVEVTRSLNF